jgi:glycosyltransferase involved in cell wall biosynthesis
VVCYEEIIAGRLRAAFPEKIIGVARNTTGATALSRESRWDTPARGRLKERLGLRHATYIVGLGRLVPEKEFERLPEVLARIRETGIDSGLILVGDGPSRQTIERRARELGLCVPGDVVFTGAIGDAQTLADWIEVTELQVHPGAVGLAVVDAAFAGIPTAAPSPGRKGPFHGPEWTYVE